MYGDEGNLFFKKVWQFFERSCESVIWRKYAPRDEDVHAIGLMHEVKKRDEKPDCRYTGFRSAAADDIRAIKTTGAGHSFSVDHDPIDGADHHTHVCFAPANGAATDVLSRGEKNDLKLRLFDVFNECVGYPA